MVWHDLLSCIFRSASLPHHKGLFWELNPEPRTSHTLSENHATRPNSQLPRLCVRTIGTVTSNFSLAAPVPAQKDPKKIISRSESACRQAPWPL